MVINGNLQVVNNQYIMIVGSQSSFGSLGTFLM